jgi:hypothetical protein
VLAASIPPLCSAPYITVIGLPDEDLSELSAQAHIRAKLRRTFW